MDQRTMEEIEAMLFYNGCDIAPGSWKMDYDKAARFKKAVDLLDAYSVEEKYSFNAHHPKKSRYCHMIELTWRINEDGMIECETHPWLTEVLANVDGIILSTAFGDEEIRYDPEK